MKSEIICSRWVVNTTFHGCKEIFEKIKNNYASHNYKFRTKYKAKNIPFLSPRFDVSEYAPEEIMVKTVDNKLLVHAKHEEKGQGKSVLREYNREFLLPQGTDPEAIRWVGGRNPKCMGNRVLQNKIL